MHSENLTFDEARAVGRLVRFLSIEGVTGHEKPVAEAVVEELLAAGVPRNEIRFDNAAARIPMPTETGNLIVQLPGTVPGGRRLFLTHLDTVPTCAGAVPVIKGNRIVSTRATALGGDNRTGVACLTNLAATLLERRLPHPPLTLLFTVREESGLWGARFVDKAMLGAPAEGFNVDGGAPADLTLGAVGADRWEVEIVGRAAHAGAHPEEGISATMVASLALADIHKNGWFGKIRRNGKEGTSNVGSLGGRDGASAGTATNVVTDYVSIRGEARSHDSRFIGAITRAYKVAFQTAAGRVKNHKGRHAKIQFRSRRDYNPFQLRASAPVVRHAIAAAESAGLPAKLRISNGGLDANWLVKHGIPTVTFGAGQNKIHAVGEYVDLSNFKGGCRLALALATLPD